MVSRLLLPRGRGWQAAVLFNTFNSRFKQEEFDKFRRLIETRGGKVIDHLYVRRGRVLFQKSRAELLEEVRGLLQQRAAGWGQTQ
jgi:hypothetical protein